MKSRIIIFICLFFVGLVIQSAFCGPLEDYVNMPDSSYTYTITAQEGSITHTYYVVDLTSQTWRSSTEVDRTLWKHWLTIIVPTSITKTKGLLVISGGNNGSPATNLRSYAQYIALLTGAPVALLEQVPNQPLRFAGENFYRTEDRIIAYTFDKYLQTYDAGSPDPYWPVLLPMVKSAVRAMDTIQEIVLNNHGKTINGFVVAGASKRGWTTWLTSAVDSRVIAAVPIVIDVLRMDVQMDHQYKCYGGFSEALQPYNEMHIFERMSTPAGTALRAIVDPISYLDRYTMPKFIINSSGDEFFLPDSSRFYYHLLPGEKRLRYVPNTGHSLGGTLDLQTVYPLITYFNSVAGVGSRPSYSWQFLPDGNIEVQVATTPTSVTLWQAENPNARDFRYYDGTGPQWTSTTLTETSPGSKTYITQITPPASGWKAYFVELNFSNGSYIFTTDVGVMPYMRPYDDLDEDGFMDPDDIDDDCDWILDEDDTYPWDSDNDGIPNYLDEVDNRDPSEIPEDCLNIPMDVVVPSVVGMDFVEANTAIIEAGLTVGTITYSCDDTVPEGAVISQSPEAGTIVREGTAVNLVLSEGPCTQEGEGISEGITEGTIEGEGIPEGEGTTEGVLEGLPEGTTEGTTEGSSEGISEGIPEGVIEGEGISEGITEGIIEGEGIPEGEGTTEGVLEGLPEGTTEGTTEGSSEGISEGIPEGVIEGEGISEGITEGTIEGEGIPEGEGTTEGSSEGISEGIPEGVIEGEGISEGITEGTIEGEGITEGEGTTEGVLEGLPEGTTEGSSEGTTEGTSEGVFEGATEGEPIPPYHSADTNKDHSINLSELLRVIQFFNSYGYHCADQPNFSEDGYIPGIGSNHTCRPHASDINRDWIINLSELLRLIQFFNSGGYYPCPDQNTEDGYCPGTSLL